MFNIAPERMHKYKCYTLGITSTIMTGVIFFNLGRFSKKHEVIESEAKGRMEGYAEGYNEAYTNKMYTVPQLPFAQTNLSPRIPKEGLDNLRERLKAKDGMLL